MLQDEDALRRHGQRGIIHARGEILQRVEDHGRRLRLEQARIRGGALQDGASRGQGAEEGDEPAHGQDGLTPRPDHRVVNIARGRVQPVA